WSRSPIVESSLQEAINNDHIQSDNFVGVDGATTSNQFATTSSGNANKSTNVDNKEDQMECRELSQRITPKNFMNTVLKDLPKSHKATIRKIGFGVLERNQEIEITPVDIHLVYGLPMGGEIIKEKKQEEDEE
uniref:Uncharacterized protein n=1 Tax=Chenopodium quinoa TaxID=63459 RepID=A0A803N7X5_CHEQI